MEEIISGDFLLAVPYLYAAEAEYLLFFFKSEHSVSFFSGHLLFQEIVILYKHVLLRAAHLPQKVAAPFFASF